MRRIQLVVLAALACHGTASAAAPDTASDERLCQAVLAMANAGTLVAAIAKPEPLAAGDDGRWHELEEQGYGVRARYVLERGDGDVLELLQLDGGGTCHSYDLGFMDSTIASFDPLVESDETFGMDVAPIRVDGEWLALAIHGNRWEFEPLAIARIASGSVAPLCRFELTGEVRREAVGADDATCAAVLEARGDDVEWQPVDDGDAKPVSPIPPHEAASADIDWFGDGRPQATWRIDYQSSAGCGMDYRFLALADPLAGPNAVDESTPAGRALFPTVERERMDRGAWWLDRVFTHAGRAWFAGQPQWGETTVNDYAVYRLDPDGVHVQCRYRHLPQFRIARRAYAAP